MAVIEFPYGREALKLNVPEERLAGILTSGLNDYVPEKDQDEIVCDALQNPIDSPKLSELAVGKEKVVIIASDHTRPVPSKYIMPHMLREIRKGNPDADITILIATGCHRETKKEELVSKFGEEIVANENIYIHDCDDESMLVKVGTLPSGGELIVNRIAAEADLLVSEGFIEPHFFAGFSGGRKSVLPGIASRKTVMYNHNAEFIDSPYARTGIIDGNPIHRDMLYAAKALKLAFICNVVINAEKKVVYAVAGNLETAHEKGRAFLGGLCGVQAIPADIAVSTNGGYPLDQNIYQSVKGMTAAEATVKKGGVIIMIAKANDGHGGESFYQSFEEEADHQKMMDRFLATKKEDTIPDQWEAQILARILLHATVIYVSSAPDEMIRAFGMIPMHDLSEALKKADELLLEKGISSAHITAIPDGVSVIVRS